MPPAIVAAAMTIGAEYVGAMVIGEAFVLSNALLAKAAFSAFVSLVGETLSRPSAQQAPMIAEVQARKQLVRASADPRRVVYGQVQVSGTLLYASNGTDTNYVHLVIALAGHSCQAIGDIWLGDTLLGALDGGGNCTAGSFAGYVRVKKYLGTTDQIPDADLNAECPEWAAKYRPLKGITYVYLRIKRSRDVFPNGLPTPRFMLTGKNDILDPRTGLYIYTPNAALCTLDYILWKHGFGSAPDEVVQSTWIAAANACDEDVALPGGGTQKRYTINGSFTLDRIPVNVLDEMRSAMAGCASYSMGVWEGHAGAASSPVMDVSEAHLRGPYKVRMRPSRAQLYNAVKGTYISAADRWVETDFPPTTNATYEAQDGGERIYKDVKLPFCIDPYAAQRIAKTDLERHRQGIVVDYPARIIGLKLKVWDVVRLNIAAMGWANKQFRIVDKKMSLFGGADLVLEEYSSAIYSWTSLEATLVDPAPDTSLSNPFTCGSPGNLAVDEALYETRGAGVKAKALVSCLAASDVFVRQYQLEYKLAAASAWTVLPAQTATSWEVNDIAPGVYNWRALAINSIGVQSGYATVSREIFGLLARPADLTGLVVQSVSALDVLNWTLSTDLDVRSGGKILVRHSPALSGATWESSTSACTPLPGASTNAVLPLRAGTYFIKAEDSSGLQSLNAASFASNGSSLFTYTTLGTVQEDPTFPGTFTNTYHDSDAGNVIELVGLGNIDDAPDFDAITNIDYYGGVVPSGYYNFNSGIDLGSVKQVRLTATLSAMAENVLDNFDDRTTDIDSWVDFDGTAGAPVDAWVEVRSTNDNPAGTPIWGAWQRLAAADFTARAFQFRAQLTSADPIYNIAIDQLRIKAEAI